MPIEFDASMFGRQCLMLLYLPRFYLVTPALQVRTAAVHIGAAIHVWVHEAAAAAAAAVVTTVAAA